MKPEKLPELTPLKAAIPSPDGRFTLTSHDLHFYQNLDTQIRQTRLEMKTKLDLWLNIDRRRPDLTPGREGNEGER